MADFYGTPTGFRIFHTARGRDVSNYSDDAIVTAGLLVGSEYLDGRYRRSFPGTKVGLRLQVREWPRVGGLDIYGYAILQDSVPPEIENANYEATLRHLMAPGSLNPDWTPPKYDRVQVTGALAVDYHQFAFIEDTLPKFAVIDELIAPVLTSPGANVSPLSGGTFRA